MGQTQVVLEHVDKSPFGSSVKAKLVAVFEDASQQVVFDETLPLNLEGRE